MYVRSFRVFDIQIAITVYIPGVESGLAVRKSCWSSTTLMPRSNFLKAFLLELPTE